MYWFRDKYIPARMMSGIKRYIMEGILPGDFLQAVIRNDLKVSFMHADDENIENMFAYAAFFYNEAPVIAWGSKEDMKSWSAKGGLIGMIGKDAAEKTWNSYWDE
jgi:hypothetical protein